MHTTISSDNSAETCRILPQKGLFSIPKPAVHQNESKIPIPSFEPVFFPKHLFDHPAAIAGWEGYEWGTRHNKKLTMHDFMEAHCMNDSRKGDYLVPPFFYPELSPLGPAIVFVLRINTDLYPVFVQMKLLEGIYPVHVEQTWLTVHESCIKAHMPNLATYCPSGRHLSLIYVHSIINKMQRESWECNNLWDKEPEIRADRSHTFTDDNRPLIQLLVIIDESNMQDYVPKGVIELLASVKGTKRVGG